MRTRHKEDDTGPAIELGHFYPASNVETFSSARLPQFRSRNDTSTTSTVTSYGFTFNNILSSFKVITNTSLSFLGNMLPQEKNKSLNFDIFLVLLPHYRKTAMPCRKNVIVCNNNNYYVSAFWIFPRLCLYCFLVINNL